MLGQDVVRGMLSLGGWLYLEIFEVPSRFHSSEDDLSVMYTHVMLNQCQELFHS